MPVHNIFALVYAGEVKNTVVGSYYDCDKTAKQIYGTEAFAVDITNIPAAVGDRYEDGVFKRLVDGEWIVIEPVPTEAQAIATLQAENAALRAELDIVSLAVLDLSEMIGGADDGEG